VLSPAEDGALAAANALLTDWAFDACDDRRAGRPLRQSTLLPYLPPAYRDAYGVLFFRRFVVCLTAVGLRLRTGEPVVVTSVADELALRAMVSVATDLLEAPPDAAPFAAWLAAVCPAPRAPRLYQRPETPARTRARRAPHTAAVERWFLPVAVGAAQPPYLDPDPGTA
jgi:hypothetical protein